MRNPLLRSALLGLLLLPIAAGCVVPGPTTPPRSQVVEADARALAYGRSAAEIFENPQLRDKLTALFGADWGPPTPGGVGKLNGAAPEYFSLGGPVRMVNVGDASYISVTGCVRQDCAKRRGLLLIREGGEQLDGPPRRWRLPAPLRLRPRRAAGGRDPGHGQRAARAHAPVRRRPVPAPRALRSRGPWPWHARGRRYRSLPTTRRSRW